MSEGQAFEVAMSGGGGRQSIDREAGQVFSNADIAALQASDTGSMSRRGSAGQSTEARLTESRSGETRINVTDTVNSLGTSLRAGNLEAFGRQMQQLRGVDAAQINTVFRQIKPMLNGTGIQANIIEGRPPKFQLARTVNEQGEQISGQNGIRQTFTFTPGRMHAQVRMAENGGNPRQVDYTEAKNIFTAIGQKVRTRMA